jgi:hypothetical protein
MYCESRETIFLIIIALSNVKFLTFNALSFWMRNVSTQYNHWWKCCSDELIFQLITAFMYQLLAQNFCVLTNHSSSYESNICLTEFNLNILKVEKFIKLFTSKLNKFNNYHRLDSEPFNEQEKYITNSNR